MTDRRMVVLVVGATGSIGRLVVEEALRKGHAVRALVRSPSKLSRLSSDVQVVVGDVTRPDTLLRAAEGMDAIVLTLGSDGGGKAGAENVDYGGVRNVLGALAPRKARIALMLDRRHRSCRCLQPLDRSSRLEASLGAARPRQRPALHDRASRMVRLQRAGSASAANASRRHPARGRLQRRRRLAAPDRRSSGSQPDLGSSFAKDLRARRREGPCAGRPRSAFRPLQADPAGALDAVRDVPNMSLNEEPERVRADLESTLRLFDSRNVQASELLNERVPSVAAQTPPTSIKPVTGERP